MTPEMEHFFTLMRAMERSKEPPPPEDYGKVGRYRGHLEAMADALLHEGLDGLKQEIARIFRDNPDLALLYATSGTTGGTEERYAGVLMSQVQPREIEWLWNGKFARRKLHSIDGDPGVGKSLVMADLAARISSGANMPDGTQASAYGGVVMVIAADELDDTLQPRLARAGACLDKIIALKEVPCLGKDGQRYTRPFKLDTDLPILEEAIDRVKAVLLIIDPLMAVIGPQRDVYRDNEVREVMAPLQLVVERKNVAGLFLRHLTKGGGTKAIYRGIGSIAFTGMVRGSFFFARDPDDPEGRRCLISHIKSNLSYNDMNHHLSYTVQVDEDDKRPYVAWGDVIERDMCGILNNPDTRNVGYVRHSILELLNEKKPESMTVAEIVESLGNATPDNVKQTLRRMVESREIAKVERGRYAAK